MFPFALLYGLGIWIRNKMFDWDVYPEQQFDLPVVNVGNLAVGGTGKTPHVEYLLRLLEAHYKTATLSRGYGRKSLGYILADSNSIAEEIGDEPLLYATKFKDTLVVVCEKRLFAIPNLIADHPETDVIIMDDAYQHRSVKPGLNILLTTFEKPFFNDFLLPAGTLREWASGYNRADVIIVTKCPLEITEVTKKEYIKKIRPLSHQHVFFTTINYGAPVHAFSGLTLENLGRLNALVFSGIANAAPFENYCERHFKSIIPLEYKDHHAFDVTEIDDIVHRFSKMSSDKIVICTEKDWMRIRATELENQFKNIPIYYLPIEVSFLEKEQKFNTLVIDYIRSVSIID